MMILVLSYPSDRTALRGLDAIQRRGHRAVLLDLADFPQRLKLEVNFRGEGWEGRIIMDDGKEVGLSEIVAIWNRRPGHYQVAEKQNPIIQAWEENEATKGVGGILRSVKCFWMNPLDEERKASFKPFQLKIASQLGWITPPTLLTNTPEAVLAFFGECEGQMIYKPINGGWFPGGGKTYHMIYTSRVLKQHLEELEGVCLTSHLFQRYIEKAYELRCTVIGDTVLTVRIDSQHAEASRTDWRASYKDLKYKRYSLPPEVEEKCLSLVKRLGLAFGAIDMIVTPGGDYVFLEINASGQFEWLAQETGLPFFETVADVLIAGGTCVH